MKLKHLHSHYFLLIILFYSVVHADQPQYLNLGPQLSRPISVLIAALVFIFFLIVFLAVYLRHYRELNAAVDSAEQRAAGVDRCVMCRGLDPDVIRAFPVVAHSKLKETEFAKWSLECAVCLSEFRDCETLRLLPGCGHVFHPNCVDSWLSYCATCPICRAEIAAGGDNNAARPDFVAIGVVADEVTDRNNRHGDSDE